MKTKQTTDELLIKSVKSVHRRKADYGGKDLWKRQVLNLEREREREK